MVLEHGFKQVPFHHRQRFAHGVDGIRPSVAIEGEPRVGVPNRVEESKIFRFGTLPDGIEGRLLARQAGREGFRASCEFCIFVKSRHLPILANHLAL